MKCRDCGNSGATDKRVGFCVSCYKTYKKILKDVKGQMKAEGMKFNR